MHWEKCITFAPTKHLKKKMNTYQVVVRGKGGVHFTRMVKALTKQDAERQVLSMSRFPKTNHTHNIIRVK